MAVREERGRWGQFSGRYRESQVGETLEQRGQRDFGLQPGQRRAEAVVHAVAEGEVLLDGTGDVELVGGVAVGGGVATGRRVADQDRVAPRDDGAVEVDGLDRVTQR